jgi:hypothetical protein
MSMVATTPRKAFGSVDELGYSCLARFAEPTPDSD